MAKEHPEDFKAMQEVGLAKLHPGRYGSPEDKAAAAVQAAREAKESAIEASVKADKVAEKASRIAEAALSPTPEKLDKATVTKVATNAETASFFSVVPKTFAFSSMLLQMTKKICETEWAWPEMDMGDFLDTYLFWTMQQRGVIIGGYQMVSKNGNGGNGHHEEAPNGSQERVGSGSAAA
ncbi:MAG: hypothetical protein WC551_14450 [Patescibacteria group bacterium]